MSCEHDLNFDQWKTFSKTMSQWEFDYELFTNLPRIFVDCDFSQSSFKLRRGILPLDKIRILTWKLLVISSENFSCELNSLRTYSLQDICRCALKWMNEWMDCCEKILRESSYLDLVDLSQWNQVSLVRIASTEVGFQV